MYARDPASRTPLDPMRFPIKVTKPNRCPVCKKPVPDTHVLATPRPESASLSFTVMSFVHGRSYPVYLGSHFMLGWDSGLAKHPQSRASLGAALFVASKDGKKPDAGQMEIHFCSRRCLRRFLNEAVDELDRRAAKVKPEVARAKQKQESTMKPAAAGAKQRRRSTMK